MEAEAGKFRKEIEALRATVANSEVEKAKYLQEIADLQKYLQELRPSDPLLSGADHLPADEETARRQVAEELAQLRHELRDTRAQLDRTRADLKASQARTEEKDNLEWRFLELKEELMRLSGSAGSLGALLYAQSMWEATQNELTKAAETIAQKEVEASKLQFELDLAREQLSIYLYSCDEDVAVPSAEPSGQGVLEKMTSAGLKRTAEEALFITDGPSKRLKHPSSITLESYIGEKAGKLLSVAQNMILREGARGGLFNPMHFKVGGQGLICITELGLERIRLFKESPSQRALHERWVEDKTAEANKRVGEILTRADFYNYGHKSLLTFATDIKRDNNLSIGNLVEGIQEVDAATRPIIGRMRESLKTLETYLNPRKTDYPTWTIQSQATYNEEMGNGRMEAMKSTANKIIEDLKLIYCHYRDGTLPRDLRLSIAITPVPGSPLIGKFRGICDSYAKLAEEAERIREDSRIPHHLVAPWEETRL